ncbi:MAG: recombinase family protein [Oscillospiraceae bacterium]|nr:recombinase family protein [Oscillospiraceae bacterium]
MAEFQVIPAIQEQPSKHRVAAYVRVSSDSEDQINSYLNQYTNYTEQIRNNPDWEFAGIYADEGITGTKLDRREEFNRLLDDCRKGKIDRVIVKSVSRFARNTQDSIATVRELQRLGVSVVFEKEDIDTSTANGEMQLAVLSSLAQEESVSISKNMRWSIQKRMQRGTFTPTNSPYGYDLTNKHLVINKEQAKIVRRIYHDFLHGKGSIEIANALNEEQVPLNHNGQKWRSNIVLFILKNEKYIGDSLMQKSYTTGFPFKEKKNRGEVMRYYQRETHPPIINRETFDKAQRLLKQKKSKFNSEEKTARQDDITKLMQCGFCKSTMRHKIIAGRDYLICHNHNLSSRTCPIVQLPQITVTNSLLQILNTLKSKRRYILYPLAEQAEQTQDKIYKGNKAISEIEKQILELNEQSQSLQRLRTKGYIDAAYYLEKTTELNANIDKLKSKKRRLLADGSDFDIAKATCEIIDALEEQSGLITELTGDLLDAIVESITALPESRIAVKLKNGMTLTEKVERKERGR